MGFFGLCKRILVLVKFGHMAICEKVEKSEIALKRFCPKTSNIRLLPEQCKQKCGLF
jgi:hypothetical protein